MVNVKASLKRYLVGVRLQRTLHSFLDVQGSLVDDILYYKSNPRDPNKDHFLAVDQVAQTGQFRFYNPNKGTLALVNGQDFHYALSPKEDTWNSFRQFSEDAKGLWGLYLKHIPAAPVARIGCIFEWAFKPARGDAYMWFTKNGLTPELNDAILSGPLVRYEFRYPEKQTEKEAEQEPRFVNVIMTFSTNRNIMTGKADFFQVSMDYQEYFGAPETLKPSDLDSHLTHARQFALDRVPSLLKNFDEE